MMTMKNTGPVVDHLSRLLTRETTKATTKGTTPRAHPIVRVGHTRAPAGTETTTTAKAPTRDMDMDLSRPTTVRRVMMTDTTSLVNVQYLCTFRQKSHSGFD
jgi:hypothetical protein